MLKTIQVNGAPYVCGRKPSPNADTIERFADTTYQTVFNDADAIRAAAKSMHPIYRAVENMLGNDKYGNCTACAALKMQAVFDCASGRTWREPVLADALWLYSQTTDPAFNPTTGANDDGTSLEAVLKFWQTHGLYKDGHGKIKAFYSVDATNKAQVQAALAACGVLYAGCNLAKVWEDITGSGFTWSMAGPPDPDAGHCTWLFGNNSPDAFDSSWGFQGNIPWDALAFYFGAANGGELYAVVAA